MPQEKKKSPFVKGQARRAKRELRDRKRILRGTDEGKKQWLSVREKAAAERHLRNAMRINKETREVTNPPIRRTRKQ